MAYSDVGGGGVGFGSAPPNHRIQDFPRTNFPGAAPPPTAAAPPSLPDYGALIQNNPYYLAAQALAAQQLSALKAQTGSNAARALVNLGDASLAKQVSGLDLPGNTGALVDQANQAGTSVLAQLGHAHEQLQKQIPATLAGRGFYRSGETGYELGQENRQYGLKQGSARQQTLDYLNNLYQNYVNAQFGIQQNQLNAYLTAYQQAMASFVPSAPPGAGPVAPPTVSEPVAPAAYDNAVANAPASGGFSYQKSYVHPLGSASGFSYRKSYTHPFGR